MKNLDTTPRNSVDEAVASCETIPHSTRSLWDLIETYAWNLVACIDTLTTLRENLKNRVHAVQVEIHAREARIGEDDRDTFGQLITDLQPWLKQHSLNGTLSHLVRTREAMAEDNASLERIIVMLEVAASILEDEMRERTFLYIYPEDANLFNNPPASFALTYGGYPSARYDIREACRCHALGCYTASVYHSMSIAQVGLHALAADLGVAFTYSMDLAEWNNVISAIETKIKPMREGPRSDEKDERISFYSDCAVQFRYFKDAWRNHVAHMREEYDRDQSHSILLHVRDFMEKLAFRIKES